MSHHRGLSHTYWFVGTLARMEPVTQRQCCKSWMVCAACGTEGQAPRALKYVFFPKTLMFGSDPVAIDRLLLEIIDDERKRRSVISIWNRSKATLDFNNKKKRSEDPNTNIIIREPGHVEYAAKLGLGVHQLSKILVKELVV